MRGNFRPTPVDLPALATEARRKEAALLERLRQLVEIESPSSDKAAVDRASAAVATWAAQAGGRVRRHRQRRCGDSLEVQFGARQQGVRPILLLGHLDTVWEKGTLAGMPWKVTRERVAGPGVLDMKAGVVMALAALELLREHGQERRPVLLLLHGDEEIGSPGSRSLTERIARRSSAVYVLEPAQGIAYKTARKAVGMYRVTVHGVAAHSGVDFASGRSAILELARQIRTIESWTSRDGRTTVNPGVIGGGTQSNVIAAQAWAEVDVRATSKAAMAEIDRAFRRLKPQDRGCRLEVTGGMNRPPMVRTAGTAALFRRARQLAAQMGFELEEASTGGGSDGNFTSALGIPTLDGMGAVGAGAHATGEHLLRAHLAPRIALLAAMLLSPEG
ncbi:MAG TPA: M20 family metallopeptidase [Acidobacteriaceae bacterium]